MKKRFLQLGLGAALLLQFTVGVTQGHAAGCTVYQHRDYKGSGYHLSPGDRLQVAGEPCGMSQSHGKSRGRYHYQPSWNDQVSSFKVTRGCTITLWQHAQGCSGGGKHFRSDQSFTYVGSKWNDKTSFVECLCR
jgi:hypothetical protein